MFLVLLLTTLFGLGARAQYSAHCGPGRTVIVHLFEWKFADIAAECERFLGPEGFCGVQVSPVNEHRVVTAPRFPWWQRYQPVSYKLHSRSGNEKQFADMVARCNNAGVRIYVDAVINHMTGGGGPGIGSGGSSFDSDTLEYPGVPFGPDDFNCCNCTRCPAADCNIFGSTPNVVRNCRLLGLRDLNLAKEYVRDKVVEFLNNVIGYGIAGFRMDACKHMWPRDLAVIYGRLNNLNTRWFPDGARPFIVQEVIDLGGKEPIKDTEYSGFGRVTEFKYGKQLGDVIRKNHGLQLNSLRGFGEAAGLLPSDFSLSFVDNHDNQRGHGSGGFGSILTFFERRSYKIANAFMLAWPYGQVRVMSSYYWARNITGSKDANDWVGPPSDSNGRQKDVTINADGSCGNGWVCEHRWSPITNMAKFRTVAEGESVSNWWDNGKDQIAFSRGHKSFVVINNEDKPLDQTLQTGMTSGSYCDVITGDKVNGRCTGRTVKVDVSGRAQFSISNLSEDPQIAIHIESRL